MGLFFGLAFLVLVGIAMFAIQNSTAPSVDLKFVVWDFRTSLVYTILGTFVSGMVVVSFYGFLKLSELPCRKEA